MTYFMQHIPCCLLRYFYIICELIGRKTCFVIGDKPNGDKPFTQTYLCLFKHRTCTNGKVLTCILTAIFATFQFINFRGLVKWWNRFSMPINGFKMFNTGFFRRKEFIKSHDWFSIKFKRVFHKAVLQTFNDVTIYKDWFVQQWVHGENLDKNLIISCAYNEKVEGGVSRIWVKWCEDGMERYVI